MSYTARHSPSRRGGVWTAVLLVHALLIWGLVLSSQMRQRLQQFEPVFTSLQLAADRTESLPPKLPELRLTVTEPIAIPLPTVQAEVMVALAVEPATRPMQVAPSTPAAATSPAVTAVPPTIPPEAIQYLVPPPLEYPRASRKLRETGRVLVRVLVDEAGMPRQAQIRTSSGHARLDAAALDAVHKARFKPYFDNGRPTAGWALIPFDFTLDT